MATDAITAIRFGLFEVDLVRGTLARQGLKLRIQEQPFRVLELLLRKNGEIVSREELCQSLWPKVTHVNFEGSLNAALKKLRAALQDDAENPRFIETVPRQGYRFLPPVHVVPGASDLKTADQLPLDRSGSSLELQVRLHPEFSAEGATEAFWDRRRAERTQRWFNTMLLTVAILFGS